jgi:anthranilate/para-aminobenzoate synthase component I
MIRCGDVYVLNLTMRLTGRPTAGPVGAFAALLESAAAPMSALWGSPDRSIVSISPERFLAVRMDGGRRRVEVWPIKGTAPRDCDAEIDAGHAAGLAASEKERAEHVMIVDMERNDLGRVCEPGSVTVDPLMRVFATPYCHQMVSRVSGVMRGNADFTDLLSATFPCGSVTGAPKSSAMRAIQELECGPRGAYTGAFIVARPGLMDSSILIRSLEYRSGGTAVWGTGCGITIDSDPRAEWCEALLKAAPIGG